MGLVGVEIIQSRTWIDPKAPPAPKLNHKNVFPITVFDAVRKDMIDENSITLTQVIDNINDQLVEKQSIIPALPANNLLTYTGIAGRVGSIQIADKIDPDNMSRSVVPTEKAIGTYVSDTIRKAITDEMYVTWDSIFGRPEVVNELGDDENKIISQKGVTEVIDNLNDIINETICGIRFDPESKSLNVSTRLGIVTPIDLRSLSFTPGTFDTSNISLTVNDDGTTNASIIPSSITSNELSENIILPGTPTAEVRAPIDASDNNGNGNVLVDAQWVIDKITELITAHDDVFMEKLKTILPCFNKPPAPVDITVQGISNNSIADIVDGTSGPIEPTPDIKIQNNVLTRIPNETIEQIVAGEIIPTPSPEIIAGNLNIKSIDDATVLGLMDGSITPTTSTIVIPAEMQRNTSCDCPCCAP